MKRHSLLLIAMCLLLPIPGCSAVQEDSLLIASEQSAAAIYRGNVMFTEETRSFDPCGDDVEPLWIAGGSELLGEAGAQFEQFVIVEGSLQPAPGEGDGASYPGAIVIESVLYAFVQEGPGCDFEWNSFHYRARGNEPFWMLEVNEEGMHLVRPDRRDESWPEVRPEQTADGLVFRPLWSVAIGPGRVEPPELTIRREICRDSMSGAYFGLAAEFRLFGEVFTGCTLVGAPSTLPGDAGS